MPGGIAPTHPILDLATSITGFASATYVKVLRLESFVGTKFIGLAPWTNKTRDFRYKDSSINRLDVSDGSWLRRKRANFNGGIPSNAPINGSRPELEAQTLRFEILQLLAGNPVAKLY